MDLPTNRRRLLTVTGVAGIGYLLSWIAGLSVPAPSPKLTSSAAKIVAALAGHATAVATQFALTEGLPAVGLAILAGILLLLFITATGITLVSQQQAPVLNHRPGDRHPLALAAGQLARMAGRPLAPRPSSSKARIPAARGLPDRNAVQLQRQGDVLGRGEPGQQVEILEHVADRAAPQPRPLVARHPRQRDAIDQHLGAGWVLQARGDGQQRALARPLRPHHRHQHPGLHRQIDPLAFAAYGRPPVEEVGAARALAAYRFHFGQAVTSRPPPRASSQSDQPM